MAEKTTGEIRTPETDDGELRPGVEVKIEVPDPTLRPRAEFYAVNDRPVKFVPTPNGGLDVQALNMLTGEFERDMSFLSRCLLPAGDVDKFGDEASFNLFVEETRRKIESDREG